MCLSFTRQYDASPRLETHREHISRRIKNRGFSLILYTVTDEGNERNARGRLAVVRNRKAGMVFQAFNIHRQHGTFQETF